MPQIDYQTAFHLAPIGLVLSRDRVIADCNDAVAHIFRSDRTSLIGQSFRVLYPFLPRAAHAANRLGPKPMVQSVFSSAAFSMSVRNRSGNGTDLPAA
jgi:PAS domain-containing protein